MALHLGEPWVLLGAEPTRTGPAGTCTKSMCTCHADLRSPGHHERQQRHAFCAAGKDFGGLREAADADVAATASREFAEETLGMFAGCGVDDDCVRQSAAQMREQITQRQLMIEVVHELRQVPHRLHAARCIVP